MVPNTYTFIRECAYRNDLNPHAQFFCVSVYILNKKIKGSSLLFFNWTYFQTDVRAKISNLEQNGFQLRISQIALYQFRKKYFLGKKLNSKMQIAQFY